jgi:hypothetical protein
MECVKVRVSINNADSKEGYAEARRVEVTMLTQKGWADWRTQTPLGGRPMRVRHSTEITSTLRGIQPPGS